MLQQNLNVVWVCNLHKYYITIHATYIKIQRIYYALTLKQSVIIHIQSLVKMSENITLKEMENNFILVVAQVKRVYFHIKTCLHVLYVINIIKHLSNNTCFHEQNFIILYQYPNIGSLNVTFCIFPKRMSLFLFKTPYYVTLKSFYL